MVAAMRNLDLRRYGPVIVILALVAVPLAIWAATSGGSDSKEKQGLLVERSVSVTGAPELVISIVGGGVELTTPADTVRIECMDKDGNVIIKGLNRGRSSKSPDTRMRTCIRATRPRRSRARAAAGCWARTPV